VFCIILLHVLRYQLTYLVRVLYYFTTCITISVKTYLVFCINLLHVLLYQLKLTSCFVLIYYMYYYIS